MTSHGTRPTSTARVSLPSARNSTYLCHGCNIMLKLTTRHYDKIEYLGPGRCAGCEASTHDGYLFKLEAEPAMKKHMEHIKNEMVWDMSQELAAERTRRRERQIAELTGQTTNKTDSEKNQRDSTR